MTDQLDLFDKPSLLPDGFRYQPNVIAPEEEAALIAQLQPLTFKEFEFQGFRGKRRVVSFGWRYDFAHAKVQEADAIPDFLLPLRDKAAAFARLDAGGLQHVLVTEYSHGAPIGWHKDRAVFGDVIGVSLMSPCIFRFRRKSGSAWLRATLTLAPRSAYVMQGASRSEWEHSIPPVAALRYSITFRNFAETGKRSAPAA
jgi:alkylated DNA repair dioxygenase AlkB